MVVINWDCAARFFDLLIATFSRSLFNMFYIRLALDSSNWINICLDLSSRILESCPPMSLWLFCWWLWTSLCPVGQVCRKIIFCVFGMFEFFLRWTLFCFSIEYLWLSYLGIHSDHANVNMILPEVIVYFQRKYIKKLNERALMHARQESIWYRKGNRPSQWQIERLTF